MKKVLKLALAASLLTIPANAYAMPEQVSDSWYGNMMRRLEVMAGNRGFCQAHAGVWICGYF
jgi:hypothetical protein